MHHFLGLGFSPLIFRLAFIGPHDFLVFLVNLLSDWTYLLRYPTKSLIPYHYCLCLIF